MAVVLNPEHCNQCLRELTKNKDGTLRVENLHYVVEFTSFKHFRIYCKKHDKLIAILNIRRVLERQPK